MIKKSLSISNNFGFTLIEVILALGILLILSGFVTINLIRQQNSTSINSTIDILTADMSSQQTKAMVGVTPDDSSGNDYGIYFMTDRYILFKGLIYDSNDPGNFTVMLDPGIEFVNINFSNNSLIYLSRSGEVSDYSDSNNSIDIQFVNTSEIKTITINRLGIITQIQ